MITTQLFWSADQFLWPRSGCFFKIFVKLFSAIGGSIFEDQGELSKISVVLFKDQGCFS